MGPLFEVPLHCKSPIPTGTRQFWFVPVERKRVISLLSGLTASVQKILLSIRTQAYFRPFPWLAFSSSTALPFVGVSPVDQNSSSHHLHAPPRFPESLLRCRVMRMVGDPTVTPVKRIPKPRPELFLCQPACIGVRCSSRSCSRQVSGRIFQKVRSI